MKTAVEWYYEQIVIEGKTNYFELSEQAKEMEKQQIIDAHLIGLIRSLEMEATKQATEYYNETYGSDDKKEPKDIVLGYKTSLEAQMLDSQIPQTEISDEEYYKDVFYQKQVMNPYPTGDQSYTAYEKGFMDFAKWYREQLKKKL